MVESQKVPGNSRSSVLADGFDLLVFDLDGTLVDSFLDIARSVNEALEHFARPPLDPDLIRTYVGDGAARLIARSLGDAAPELLDAALAVFLRSYRRSCLATTRTYPGVAQALEALARRPLAVLTNKPLDLSLSILEGLGLRGYFREVVAGDSGPPRKPDPSGLLGLVDRHGGPPGRCLMIGDSAVDVKTARAAGTRSAGVTYGFRPDELGRCPPDFLLRSLEELVAPARRPGATGLP
ncbi:MAG: HAD-IA family hydrolase [Planctomycetota bacterium]|nr:HAD-IA family hydrolase [Planctomycetota bacterium]